MLPENQNIKIYQNLVIINHVPANDSDSSELYRMFDIIMGLTSLPGDS